MDSYLAKISSNGFYGDGVIIQVVEIMFGKRIQIFRYKDLLTLTPENFLKEMDEKCLWMGYVNFISDSGLYHQRKITM